MNNYKVKFTNESETCTHGEYTIYNVIGQIEALTEAQERHLDRHKGEINRPGFRVSMHVHISPLE